MKKAVKVSTIILGIMFLIGGGILGKMYMDEKKLNAEMLKVVKSEEAKKAFEESLKNLDKNALTTDGIIQSYEVDYNSVKHNPMGGIDVTVYANKNKELYVFFTIEKNNNGELKDGGGGNSSKLESLLKEK